MVERETRGPKGSCGWTSTRSRIPSISGLSIVRFKSMTRTLVLSGRLIRRPSSLLSSSVVPVRVSRALSTMIATPCRSPIPSGDLDLICGGQHRCLSHPACCGHETQKESRSIAGDDSDSRLLASQLCVGLERGSFPRSMASGFTSSKYGCSFDSFDLLIYPFG